MKCAVPRWMTFNVVFKPWEMLWLVQNTLGKLWCVDTVQLCLICGITPDVCLTKALRSNLLDKNIQEWQRKQVINRGFGHPNSLDSSGSTIKVWFWPIRNCLSCLSWSSPGVQSNGKPAKKVGRSHCPIVHRPVLITSIEYWSFDLCIFLKINKNDVDRFQF